MGAYPAYLLHLSQVDDHESVPSIWKSLSSASNRQQLMFLQQAFNDTERWIWLHTPIVVTLGILKMIPSFILCLYHRNYLGMGLHQFCLGQHTSASRKFLKARVDQHQVIADGGESRTLVDNAYLQATYGVSLTETLTMKFSVHTRLWVVFKILLGRDNPDDHRMDMFSKSIM